VPAFKQTASKSAALSPVDTHSDFKLPFWGLESPGKTYRWLQLTPISHPISFTMTANQLARQGSHAFNCVNQQHSFNLLRQVRTLADGRTLNFTHN